MRVFTLFELCLRVDKTMELIDLILQPKLFQIQIPLSTFRLWPLPSTTALYSNISKSISPIPISQSPYPISSTGWTGFASAPTLHQWTIVNFNAPSINIISVRYFINMTSPLVLVLCSAPSVPQPVVQLQRRPLLGPSPGWKGQAGWLA